MHLMPRKPVPSLEFDLLGGGRWNLKDDAPERFNMLVFYRGYHCPQCRRYMTELNGMGGEFEKRGVKTVLVSNDTEERARLAKDQWGLPNLRIGYGLPVEKSREWGLYVSTGRGKTSAGVEEPALFAEPGVFFVKPDQTLYWASIATMPFARPHFPEILQAVDFVVSKDYPARGEA